MKDITETKRNNEIEAKHLAEACAVILELGYKLKTRTDMESHLVRGAAAYLDCMGVPDEKTRENPDVKMFGCWFEAEHAHEWEDNVVDYRRKKKKLYSPFKGEYTGPEHNRKWFDCMFDIAEMMDKDSRLDEYVNEVILKEDLVKAYNRSRWTFDSWIDRYGREDYLDCHEQCLRENFSKEREEKAKKEDNPEVYIAFWDEEDYTKNRNRVIDDAEGEAFVETPAIAFRFGHPEISENKVGENFVKYAKELRHFFDVYVLNDLGTEQYYDPDFINDRSDDWEAPKAILYHPEPWDYKGFFMNEGSDIETCIENITRAMRFFSCEMDRRFKLLSAAYAYVDDNIGIPGCFRDIQREEKLSGLFDERTTAKKAEDLLDASFDEAKFWRSRCYFRQVPQLSPYTFRDAMACVCAWCSLEVCDELYFRSFCLGLDEVNAYHHGLLEWYADQDRKKREEAEMLRIDIEASITAAKINRENREYREMEEEKVRRNNSYARAQNAREARPVVLSDYSDSEINHRAVSEYHRVLGLTGNYCEAAAAERSERRRLQQEQGF